MTHENRKHLKLDIDQTLAGGVVAVHLRFYNERLRLGMTETEIVAAAAKYTKTFDVPEVIAYRKVSEDKFQQTRAEIRTSQQVHRQLEMLPGAKNGVDTLAKHSQSVSYHTVRPIEVIQATKDWLQTHQFHSANNLTTYENPMHKLQGLLEDTVTQQILLIDDSLRDLLTAAGTLADTNPKLKAEFGRLVLVGFGHTDVKASGLIAEGQRLGIEVLTLPTWEAITILDLITKAKLVPTRNRFRN